MKKIAIRSLWALGLVGLLLGGAALFAKPSARREAPQEPASQQKPTPKPEEQKPAENKTEAQLLDQMTPEQKIGQVFLVRCPEDSQLKETQALHPGGLLLFGRDFKGKTADQVRQTIQGYQQTSQTPLFIGADEEGGTVCRVSGNPGLRAERFPSPQQLYQAGGLEAVAAVSGNQPKLGPSGGRLPEPPRFHLSPNLGAGRRKHCPICGDDSANRSKRGRRRSDEAFSRLWRQRGHSYRLRTG